MRAVLRAVLATALVTTLVAAPGAAEETTTALTETLYLDGTQQVGELETPDTFLTAYRRMTAEAPTGSDAKSVQVVNYLRGPNTKCSGNGLVPTWEAAMDGTLSGPVTVTLNTAGIPASTMQVRLFADAGMNACNDAFIPPIADKTVNVATGQAETVVTFENVSAPVTTNLVLMLNAPETNVKVPEQPSPAQPFAHTRVFFDAASAASRIQFGCTPTLATATTCLVQ